MRSIRSNLTAMGTDARGASKNEAAAEIINLFFSLFACIRGHSFDLLTAHKVTYPQLVVLELLNGAGEVKVSDLSAWVNLSSSTVSGILDRLEREGMVTRIRGVKDRRVVQIELTEKGEATLRSIPSHRRDVLSRSLMALSYKERMELRRLLMKLTTSLSKIVSL